MVHGLLLASNFEFFITCLDSPPKAAASDAASTAEALRTNTLLGKDESDSDEAAWASFFVKVPLDLLFSDRRAVMGALRLDIL